jgi:hypothetical protein
MLEYTNRSGPAIPAIPTKMIAGAGLAHRRLTALQRAVLVADVLDGAVAFSPSQKQLAALFGVSAAYVRGAQKLSSELREAILHGWDSRPLAELMHQTRQLQLKLPASNCASITNAYLENVIRAAGVDRVLEAAVAVEHNT